MNPIENARVLTVVGSGDQPLFYAAHGASVVDTFDISYCANVIHEIKKTAIRANMKYDDYVGTLLMLLQSMPDKTSNVLSYMKLSNVVHPDIMRFVNAMYGCKIFRDATDNGFGKCLPTRDVYDAMRKNQTGGNFYWTDLQQLHIHLDKKYDQIYLSNILSYNQDDDYVMPLLKNLKPFIARHGQIMLHTEYASGASTRLEEMINNITKKVAPWATVEFIKDTYNHRKPDTALRTYILQRQK
jgi:hypothetical protein